MLPFGMALKGHGHNILSGKLWAFESCADLPVRTVSSVDDWHPGKRIGYRLHVDLFRPVDGRSY